MKNDEKHVYNFFVEGDVHFTNNIGRSNGDSSIAGMVMGVGALFCVVALGVAFVAHVVTMVGIWITAHAAALAIGGGSIAAIGAGFAFRQRVLAGAQRLRALGHTQSKPAIDSGITEVKFVETLSNDQP